MLKDLAHVFNKADISGRGKKIKFRETRKKMILTFVLYGRCKRCGFLRRGSADSGPASAPPSSAAHAPPATVASGCHAETNLCSKPRHTQPRSPLSECSVSDRFGELLPGHV